jgi:hypothetical protein
MITKINNPLFSVVYNHQRISKVYKKNRESGYKTPHSLFNISKDGFTTLLSKK